MSRFNLKPLRTVIKEILLPTISQVVFFVTLACLVLTGIFFSYFFKTISGDPTSTAYLSATATDYLNKLDTVPFAENLTTILLWGTVGIFVYVFTITIINFFIILANKYELNKGGLGPKLDSFSLFDEYRRVSWLFISGIFLAFSFVQLMPFWIDITKTSLLQSTPLTLLFAVVGLATNLYFAYMLVWVTIRNPNLIARK